MISLVRSLGVHFVLKLVLVSMQGFMPDNHSIAALLATPECHVDLSWSHQRHRKCGMNDPLFKHPDQRRGTAIVFEPPWVLAERMITTMSRCQRYELLQAMIQNGLIPGRSWDQPDPPPSHPACRVEPIFLRVWNVTSSVAILVNDDPILEANAGFEGVNKLKGGVPGHGRPGDSGVVNISEFLRPGVNTVGFKLLRHVSWVRDNWLFGHYAPRAASAFAEIMQNGETVFAWRATDVIADGVSIEETSVKATVSCPSTAAKEGE